MKKLTFIGRNKEIARLNKYAQSNQAEFVAIYGRRRVGKTYLVNNVFKKQLSFSMTGIIGGNRDSQFQAFVKGMNLCGVSAKMPKSWFDAFSTLQQYLSSCIKEGEPCVIFIDELPCFDTRKSRFVEALGHFWNSWASLHPEIMLIVCGSATSWMMENVIDSHGGLHNRITHEIHLKEFCLAEVEEYFLDRGFHWDRSLILQAYMIMGGVPYYLSLLDKDLSLSQNIDSLFFDQDGEMSREFYRLYKTLFSKSDPYISIIEALFNKKKGLNRNEIAQATNMDANGRLTELLRNLVDCDIIRRYPIKQKTISARNSIYQLTDFFSLFFLQFMKGNINEPKFWTKNLHLPKINSWMGLAFERVCMAHIEQIKHALGIDYISANYYSWRSVNNKETLGNLSNAQIDLVIERADKMTHICEAKYSETPYIISKNEYTKFVNRIAVFKQQTHYAGGIIPTFITSSQLVRNTYSESLGLRHIALDDLFKQAE